MEKNIFDLANEPDYVDPSIVCAMEEEEALRFTESQGATLEDLDAKPLTKAQEMRKELIEKALTLQDRKLAAREKKQQQDYEITMRKLEIKERKDAQLLAMQAIIATKFAKKE